MLMKVKIRLLVDKVSNLFQKKKPVKPDFRRPLYAQGKAEPKKSLGSHAIAFLLPVVRECGVVVWGDVKWLMNRRRQCPADAWADAIERMQRDQK